MKVHVCAFFLVASSPSAVLAQVNEKGDLHLSLGLVAGVHATEYRTSFLGFSDVQNDAAVTSTIPIEAGYSLGGRFSLGILIEPGLYLDSTETESNALRIYAVQPRFFLVNGRRVAWLASAQFGTAILTYDVDVPGNVSRTIYRGGFWGLSTGMGAYFSDHIGLNLQLRYMATTMPARDAEINGQPFDLSVFNAELRTSGLALQASLAFTF